MDADQGPEPLSEIMSRLFIVRGWGRQQSQLRLEDTWRQKAGIAIADRTRLGTLKRGVLEVLVRDSVLLHELAHYHKQRLLTALQASLGAEQVKDLRFRLGSWDAG